MPRDANGNFTPVHNFTTEYNAGQKTIRADYMDEQFSDLATAITSDTTTGVRNSALVRRNAAGKIFGDILGNSATATDLAAGSVLSIGKGGTNASNAGDALTNLGVSSFGKTLLDDADAVTARATLGLGSAALLTAGTGANNLVQLNGSGQLPAVDGSLLTGLSDGLPVGLVIAVASETVPTGYLECNGAAISRTTYARLFSAIGVVHGYGDNSTTFNLPDYRGRFMRGWAHGSTRDPDRASRTAMATGGQTGDHVGSVQADEFKAHTHAVPKAASVVVGSEYSGGVSGTSNSGSAGGNETRPVNAYVMFCIKY